MRQLVNVKACAQHLNGIFNEYFFTLWPDEDSFINSNESDDEDDYYDYNDVDEDAISQEEVDLDPEAFEYRIITEFEAEEMFDDCVENLAKRLKVWVYCINCLINSIK